MSNDLAEKVQKARFPVAGGPGRIPDPRFWHYSIAATPVPPVPTPTSGPRVRREGGASDFFPATFTHRGWDGGPQEAGEEWRVSPPSIVLWLGPGEEAFAPSEMSGISWVFREPRRDPASPVPRKDPADSNRCSRERRVLLDKKRCSVYFSGQRETSPRSSMAKDGTNKGVVSLQRDVEWARVRFYSKKGMGDLIRTLVRNPEVTTWIWSWPPRGLDVFEVWRAE